jgi:hypothetical protein
MSEPRFFYANSTEVGMSGYDMTLKFMRNGTPGDVGQYASPGGVTQAQTVVQDILAVGMSPSHAKAVVAGLLRAVLSYEEQYGKIPLPPETQSVWDAVRKA